MLRFTVTTSLLAMPAAGCHRSGPPGGVYVNEGPVEVPEPDPLPTTADAPAGATDGDAPTEPVAETSPPLDITPHEPDSKPDPKVDPKPVIITNTGPQEPPPKPKVIVNPGPADRGGTTPTTPPRP